MNPFEENEKEERLSHLKNLVKLMTIDGVIAESERKFLVVLGQKWGLTKNEFNEVILHPNKIKFSPPNPA